jgi:toxin ParE1/3/4
VSRGVLSPQARRDLAEIWDYIAKHSEAEADEMIDELNAKFRLLRRFPYLGRRRDDLRAGYRSVVERGYVVLYRIVRRSIQIMRVIHGKRDIPTLLRQ